MHYFEYRNGVLHAEGVALPDLARAVETPFYCYSAATIRRLSPSATASAPGSASRVSGCSST